MDASQAKTTVVHHHLWLILSLHIPTLIFLYKFIYYGDISSVDLQIQSFVIIFGKNCLEPSVAESRQMQLNGKMVTRAAINQVLVHRMRSERPEDANSY